MKPHVWVVEMKREGRDRWVPTVGCALTREDSKYLLANWRKRNPYDTLRLRKYERNHRELVSLPPDVHVRAELNRLAGQVKKLIALGVERKRGKTGAVLRREVLELIEQAKR